MLEKLERIRSNMVNTFEHRMIFLRDSDVRSEVAMQSIPDWLALFETSRDHHFLWVLEQRTWSLINRIKHSICPWRDRSQPQTCDWWNLRHRGCQASTSAFPSLLKRCFDVPVERHVSRMFVDMVFVREASMVHEKFCSVQLLKASRACKALPQEWAWQASLEPPDSHGGCRSAKLSEWHQKASLRSSSSMLDRPWWISESGSHSQHLNRLLPLFQAVTIFLVFAVLLMPLHCETTRGWWQLEAEIVAEHKFLVDPLIYVKVVHCEPTRSFKWLWFLDQKSSHWMPSAPKIGDGAIAVTISLAQQTKTTEKTKIQLVLGVRPKTFAENRRDRQDSPTRESTMKDWSHDVSTT